MAGKKSGSEDLARRAMKIVKALAKAYPKADCALDVTNPYEVLAATVLSAQCTDKKVNEVTPELFSRYPSPKELAKARTATVEKIIHSIGLYRNKAKNLVAAAKMIMDDFGGEVPGDIDTLVNLPGVGRKTANCVLVNGFGKPGIMCDTHCCRVSRRLGLHEEKDPVKIEFILAELLPPKEWGNFSHRIIIHGREKCHARKPECDSCPLRKVCDYPEKGGK